MSTENAIGSNQHKTKKKGFKMIRFVIIIIVLAIVGDFLYIPIKQFVQNINTVDNYSANPSSMILTPTQDQVKASDIEKRMVEVKSRADHKAIVAKFDDTEARRVATAEYETEETAKYKAIQDEIEKSKEQVRKDQVSF